MKFWTDPSQPLPLTSIILVTFNKVELTLSCIESIYAHTEAAFEVIVLDNASSDTTVADVRGLDKPNLTVIANPNNDGFGRGCNIGAEAAAGEYLIFLNNDTLVCPGWLRRMLLKMRAHPQLGMVGPMTNVASNAQLIGPHAEMTEHGFLEEAARIAQRHDGQLVMQERLIGFCMAIPRAVWDEVGGFDEGFGIGHYEDDDLCVKIARAGYQLGVAKDVYVFHFAGQSFDAAGIARVANMRQKAFLFYKKWGNAYADWPSLLLNLCDLTHVVAAVDSPSWTPPMWIQGQPAFLVSAVCRQPSPAIETALGEHQQDSRILSYRTPTIDRPLGEALNVGMQSHAARGQLLVAGDVARLPGLLEHIEAQRPPAALYRRGEAEGRELVAYYISRDTLDALGGLAENTAPMDGLALDHLRRTRAAGIAGVECTLAASGPVIEHPRPASTGSSGRSNLARRGANWLRSQIATLSPKRWNSPPAVNRPSGSELVNITMLSYGRLNFTKRAVAAVAETTRHPHRLVVVDNGSDEETVAWLQRAQQSGDIDVLILNPENRGVAPAANQGWLALDAPYYVKLDNDIVLTKHGWLAELVAAYKQLPDAGMLGYNFEDVSYPLKQRASLRVRPKLGHLGGACVLIGKRAHDAVGYWCEDYFPYSEEDCDMGLRLGFAGFTHYYLEDEDAGLHLPHGRATPLEKGESLDDENDPDYRRFKDDARRSHIGRYSTFWINKSQYERGVRSLYCQPGQPQRGIRLALETALFKALRFTNPRR
jgi:GT2 family glycosyltransferase